MAKGKGQIFNHSSHELLVIETDSGKPIAHRLGPKRKSPSAVDADGFRRADRKPILLHGAWWKVPDNFKADIFELGRDFLVPVSVMLPVSDGHFGSYKINEELDWGEKLIYVTNVIKDKRKKTLGYNIENRGRVSVSQAIKLADAGKIDNVVVVKRKNGTTFLRTKKNMRFDDNLTA